MLGQTFGNEQETQALGSQIVYEYLDMKAPEIVQKKIDVATEASGDSVSMEVLPEYIGDYVIRSSYEGMDDLTTNQIWNSIPAVKEGRLIELSFSLSYYSDIFTRQTARLYR